MVLAKALENLHVICMLRKSKYSSTFINGYYNGGKDRKVVSSFLEIMDVTAGFLFLVSFSDIPFLSWLYCKRRTFHYSLAIYHLAFFSWLMIPMICI